MVPSELRHPRAVSSAAALAAAIVLAVAPAGIVSGQNAPDAVDPADVYLQAYLLKEEGEKLEKREDLAGAYDKFREASDLFDSVARNFPDWERHMVNYRRTKIREQLEAARSEYQRKTGGSLAPGQPAHPLPLPDNTAPRSQSLRPSAVVRAPGTSIGSPSTAAAEIQQVFAQYEASIRRLEADRAELDAALAAKEASLRDAQRQLLQSQRMQGDLQRKLVESEQNLDTAGGDQSEEIKALKAEVADLTSKLSQATQAMAKANEETGKLLADLGEANETIRQLRETQKKIESERDQLAALIAGQESDPASASALKVENMKLQRQLGEAQEKIAQLGEERDADQQTIASLREELTSVKAQLASIQQENLAYRQKIDELTARLRETGDRLAAAPQMTEEEALQENRTLRAIILRQLKQQARREQAKRLVLAQLQKLEVNSEDLLATIEEVAGPPIVLDEREQSLFKDPQFDDFLAGQGVHAALLSRRNPATEGALANTMDPAEAAGSGQIEPELMRHASDAAIAFGRGDFAEAELHYETILETAPQSVFAMEDLSVVKLRMQKFSEAETLLKKAIAYNFDNAGSHFLLGVTYFRQGESDLAAASLEQGLMIDPANARAHLYLGVIATRDGNLERAELEFQEAIQIDPGLSDAHFNLAVLYSTADDPSMPRARKHYEEAIQSGAKPDEAMEKFLGS